MGWAPCTLAACRSLDRARACVPPGPAVCSTSAGTWTKIEAEEVAQCVPLRRHDLRLQHRARDGPGHQRPAYAPLRPARAGRVHQACAPSFPAPSSYLAPGASSLESLGRLVLPHLVWLLPQVCELKCGHQRCLKERL